MDSSHDYLQETGTFQASLMNLDIIARRGSAPRRGMTLVELLVVIAIIAVLVGLLLPAIQYARNSSRRTTCLSNLHNVGLAMNTYMDYYGQRSRYPDAAQLPELVTNPTKPSLVTVLGPYSENNAGIFVCPGDDAWYRDNDLSLQNPPLPPEGLSYFEKDGISYEYQWSSLAKKTRQQVNANKSSSTVIMSNDFDPYHGPTGDTGSRCYLYADGHSDSS
jgi:prepilin-type N-terminal cleavage/methylation domain-containing protein